MGEEDLKNGQQIGNTVWQFTCSPPRKNAAAVVAGMVGPASDRGRTRTPLAVGLGALAASVLLALLA